MIPDVRVSGCWSGSRALQDITSSTVSPRGCLPVLLQNSGRTVTLSLCRSEIRFGPMTCGFSVGRAACVYSLIGGVPFDHLPIANHDANVSRCTSALAGPPRSSGRSSTPAPMSSATKPHVWPAFPDYGSAISPGFFDAYRDRTRDLLILQAARRLTEVSPLWGARSLRAV